MKTCHIVIPTYNRRHILEHTIPHYLTLGTAITVVDDCSTDGTSDWLESLGITTIRHERRRGAAAARNTGLRATNSSWVLFGEDDVIFAPDHVSKLLEEAHNLPHCAVVAGSLFTGKNWEIPVQRPPWEPGPLLDHQLLLANFGAALEKPIPLPTVHGCALVDRSVILEAGGYDETFTNSCFREESECYARLWHTGKSVWLTPKTWAIHVRHRLGGGCRGNSDLIKKFINRISYLQNNSIYVDRHHWLWNQWHTGLTPGTLKWNFLKRLVAQQVSAIRNR